MSFDWFLQLLCLWMKLIAFSSIVLPVITLHQLETEIVKVNRLKEERNNKDTIIRKNAETIDEVLGINIGEKNNNNISIIQESNLMFVGRI